jgi:signal transduction histidine kinase
MKHAGAGAQATVRLAFRPAEFEIEVSDDGTGASVPDPGNGLRGIAERVSLLGGELIAGPGEAGGFRVRARLPLRPAEVTAGAPA